MKTRSYVIPVLRLALVATVMTSLTALAAPDIWWTNSPFLKDVGEQVHAFFGNTQGSYYFPHEQVAEQVGQGLGGAPQREMDIDGGKLHMFAASRPGSGREHAAVVLDDENHLRYAALIHFNCIEPTTVSDAAIATRLAQQNAGRDRMLSQGVPASSLPLRHIAVTCSAEPELTIFTHSAITDDLKATMMQWAAKASQLSDIKTTVRVVP